MTEKLSQHGMIDYEKKKSLKNRISRNIERVAHFVDLFDEYDRIEESSAYTKFTVTHVQFILTLNLQNMSLLELFNTVRLNPNVPFATVNNFYKILLDFLPPEEWVGDNEESIIFQVSQKNFISTSSNSSNYEKAIMRVNQETNAITTEITINTDKSNISRNEFSDRFLSVFQNIDIYVKNVEESKVIGVFYIPLLRLDKYVFSDLVMNDEIFSRLISIDDHEKATKKKSGIYIHFNHPETGYITATLTEKTMIKGDPTMKNVDLDFF